mgnify:CR=1 FL=1
MVLQRWDPFAELRHTDEALERLWGSIGVRTVDGGMGGWSVPLDVVQGGDNILVHASLPGVKPEDIQVTIENDILTIKGEPTTDHEERNGHYLMRERRAGRFHRALRLPDTLDADKGESRYESGVLTVKFPKVEAKKAKKLEVKVAK